MSFAITRTVLGVFSTFSGSMLATGTHAGPTSDENSHDIH